MLRDGVLTSFSILVVKHMDCILGLLPRSTLSACLLFISSSFFLYFPLFSCLPAWLSALRSSAMVWSCAIIALKCHVMRRSVS
jgi:Na+-transporting NADH:ubiquinone oxidoreductase subunit NqrB